MENHIKHLGLLVVKISNYFNVKYASHRNNQYYKVEEITNKLKSVHQVRKKVQFNKLSVQYIIGKKGNRWLG